MYQRMSVAELDAELSEYAEDLASKWWWFLGFGIISVLIGLWILFWTDWREDPDAVVLFFGIVLLVWGAFRLISGFVWYGEGKWWLMLSGAFGIALGIATLVWPDPTLLVVASLIALWLFVTGALNIIAGLFQKREPRWAYVVWGVVGLFLGVWAWNREVVTLLAVIFFIGLGFLLSGIMEIIVSFQVKSLPQAYQKARDEAYTQLNTLADLHAKGVLTDEEYAREKAKVLIG